MLWLCCDYITFLPTLLFKLVLLSNTIVIIIIIIVIICFRFPVSIINKKN